MKRLLLSLSFVALISVQGGGGQQRFTLDQVLSAPFPANLVASKTGARLAWTLNEQGHRNIWVAEGPSFTARRLTAYNEDDGEALSHLRFSPDGAAVIYVRGEGKNDAGQYANPTSNPAGVEQAVWMIPWSGGEPTKIDGGSLPCVSAQGEIAYAKDGQIWATGTAAGGKPKVVVAHGKNEPVAWSPDGTRLLFISRRMDHSFVGIFDTKAQTVKFIAPSVDRDMDGVWSLDGKRIAYVRVPSQARDAGDRYYSEPERAKVWAIWVADAETGSAREIWHSGTSLQSSYPEMAGDTGGGVLNWAADNRIVFASEEDGWQHLYAISAAGGATKLLTPGSCEVEQWSFSGDKGAILFNSNCEDVDRRHLWRVDVTGGALEAITKGDSIEWGGVFLGDGEHVAYFSSGAKHTGRAFVCGVMKDANPVALAPQPIPADFPADQLVVPQQVVFKSGDGLEIHGQLFLPRNLKAGEKRAAVIFFHGGPPRQMLLGWHYMYYYSNAYGMNQYLANRGYIVLSVNYRDGIGYGRAFREAENHGPKGASEYLDVVEAAKYLAARSDVDAKRIGLWGGSYGGYLTALGLARNSDLFAAGVDLHGVHDWAADIWDEKYVAPEWKKAAHDSSPVAFVDTWKSPVLFIHGDDDRNVAFSQTVDLIARLRAKGVHLEQLVFPDEVHNFLLHRHWLEAYRAASEFFDRQIGGEKQ
ncbi:MAG TPA: prolyl oligopeptidase family serine peptidase [Verrucomicrobiae bacterium]|nr:prolyl oligopeptidase family serine peptidase [Verrucomicrobiae bacterium]